jgi:hypothetical protein
MRPYVETVNNACLADQSIDVNRATLGVFRAQSFSFAACHRASISEMSIVCTAMPTAEKNQFF